MAAACTCKLSLNYHSEQSKFNNRHRGVGGSAVALRCAAEQWAIADNGVFSDFVRINYN